ncbi:hypothetical protein BDQ17DRAFT_1219718, partial [Cyathus striatus]
KKSKIYDLAEKYQTLISPARRLTEDILQEILLACLPEDHNPCINAAEAPILLTHICSAWRSIAHRTPWLWAAIHIPIPSAIIDLAWNFPPQRSIVLQEDLVRLTLDQREVAVKDWLSRSGACPLSISIFQMHGSNLDIGDNYVANSQKLQELYISFLKNTIIPYHQRWYRLNV